MAYNKDFDLKLKKDQKYQKYIREKKNTSNWGTLKTKHGKVTFNKAAFGVCVALAGWSALNIAALIVRPEYSLVSFDGLKYGIMGGLAIKFGYGFFQREKAKTEERKYTKIKK